MSKFSVPARDVKSQDVKVKNQDVKTVYEVGDIAFTGFNLIPKVLGTSVKILGTSVLHQLASKKLAILC